MIKIDNVEDLYSLREIDCKGISKELKRSWKSCWDHWQYCLLPILKTHKLDLPQSLEWKKDVLKHIIHKKVEVLEDVDYNQLVQDVCPGQTTQSLQIFIANIRRTRVEGKHIMSKEPLHELASKSIRNPGHSSSLCSETMEEKKYDHACSIVKMYEDLKAAKNIRN